MTIARKTARKAVSALLATLADFEAVYDYEKEDFERVSPVAMVHSDGTTPEAEADTLGCDLRAHGLIVSIFWRRVDTTEDSVDDLSELVFDLLESNAQAAAEPWQLLRIDDDFSAMDYPIIDGIQYRRESIRVIVW